MGRDDRKKPFLDEALAARFRCPRCGGTGAELSPSSPGGGLFASLARTSTGFYINVSCSRCGFTDFFRRDLLEALAKDGGLDTLYTDL